jgi:hypothetical protein
LQPRCVRCVHGDHFGTAQRTPRHRLCHLGNRQPDQIGTGHIDLGQHDDAAAHTHELEDPQVLLGLRLPSLVRRHHEQARVHRAHPGQHVLDEPHVPWDIYERDGHSRRADHLREAQVDRQPSPPLLGEPIGLHPREPPDQHRLAMIHMAGSSGHMHRRPL